MESIVKNIHIGDFNDIVFKRFKELCGFFENTEIDKDRIDEAVLCFDQYIDYFDVKVIYSFFDKDIFFDNDIYVDENIFSDILKSDVIKFIFFAVSADIIVDDLKILFNDNILKEYYFDLTGTAIIDVTRDILKKKFEMLDFIKENNFFVSKPFGVGFFGIENKEIIKFFKLLDCSKIGISINESGVIKPDKSFIGFFAVSQENIFIETDCKNCIGRGEGCFFCRKK